MIFNSSLSGLVWRLFGQLGSSLNKGLFLISSSRKILGQRGNIMMQHEFLHLKSSMKLNKSSFLKLNLRSKETQEALTKKISDLQTTD